ncbi:acetyltransferase At1g77540 [Brachypodium distachyon]|uniref:acetyltransferase At1g77540 n=1 Tax=Brachypodium distachyon TaxID=15368 RepID=UPI0001C6FE8C|nr:acetyltransferase At1g77540 [Brachypodium distachyon]|eukprot:XP_003579764.1 acetyltransferase At1g77540 [Brachypodium distachyon]
MAKEGGAGEREAAEDSIVWREEARRFETPDGRAFLQYRLVALPRASSGGATPASAAMVMVHTYVPGSKRGRGLASRLCDAAFAHARRHGLRVIPTCSYISDTYLPRNPAWNELLCKDDEPKPSNTSSSM